MILSANSYYPFGMLMPNRTYTAPNADYNYGFNGMEQDNEVNGQGNALDFGARVYDSRIGRFLSKDAFSTSFASISSFQFAGNKPITSIDENGNFEQLIIINTNSKGETVSMVFTASGISIYNAQTGESVHQAMEINWSNINEEINSKFRQNEDVFAEGFAKFTGGGDNSTRGTLVINNYEGVENPILYYLDTDIYENESMLDILYRDLIVDPDQRTKDMVSTIKNYTTLVTLPITFGLTLEAAGTLELIGGISSITNTIDDYSTGVFGDGQTAITYLAGDRLGYGIKSTLNVAGVLSVPKGIPDYPIGSVVSGTSDLIQAVDNASQCLDTEPDNIERVKPPLDDVQN